MNQNNNTVQANAILEDIAKVMDGKSHVLTYDTENPQAVRQSLRKRMKDYFPTSLIVVRCINEYRHNLIVNIKEEPTVMKYEKLLRKALLHIDDEIFYEEVLDAINPVK